MPEIDVSELPEELDTHEFLDWAAKHGEYRAFDIVCRFIMYRDNLAETRAAALRDAADL